MREGSNNVSRGLTNSCYWLVSMALGAMADSAGSWNMLVLSGLAKTVINSNRPSLKLYLFASLQLGVPRGFCAVGECGFWRIRFPLHVGFGSLFPRMAIRFRKILQNSGQNNGVCFISGLQFTWSVSGLCLLWSPFPEWRKGLDAAVFSRCEPFSSSQKWRAKSPWLDPRQVWTEEEDCKWSRNLCCSQDSKLFPFLLMLGSLLLLLLIQTQERLLLPQVYSNPVYPVVLELLEWNFIFDKADIGFASEAS